MGGHRRDASESQIPLRQCTDYQHSCSDREEVRLNIGSDHENSIPNGVVTPTHGNELPSNHSAHQDDDGRRKKRCCLHTGSECTKTLCALFCLSVSAFCNFFLLTVIHDLVPKEPLPDLVFMIVPQQRWAWSVGDVFSTLNSVIGFACVLLHKRRMIVLRRVFLLGAIMYLLRALVMAVTYMPPSIQDRDAICQPQMNKTNIYSMELATRFFTYVLTLGLTSGQSKILCGDLMFSGHTVVLTIMYFTQLQYTPKRLKLLRLFSAPITYLGMLALVISGGHYTMDVLVAYWLTSHVFWSYHQMFEAPKVGWREAPLSNLWWARICGWFESEVPDGPLKNEWDWPFARPLFMRSLIDKFNDK